ncbi:hypothetical protein I79_023786 [Cricetulus griseus]|uniref:Uncharacterized protein n=1 Tax=Cricetulus griseus TaxID=10029 RepID=G3IIV8_CRIGR|nr:hypothetical protein I79_023786 [Cricetulus griseus]
MRTSRKREAPAPRSDSPGPEACLSALSGVVYSRESEPQPPLPQGKKQWAFDCTETSATLHQNQNPALLASGLCFQMPG